MKDILDFLRDNWKVIVELVVLVTTIILWIIRKKPVKVVDTLKETIIRLLPYCINEAEKGDKGSKLDLCLSILTAILGDMGIELNDDYKKFAADQVEIILSTPTKKGVTYEK